MDTSSSPTSRRIPGQRRYPRRSSLPDHEMFSFYHHDRSVSVFGSQIFDGNEEDEFSLSYMNEEAEKLDEELPDSNQPMHQRESHVSKVKLRLKSSSLPTSSNYGVYNFYHCNRPVSVFGSEALQVEREFSLSFTGDEVAEVSDEQSIDESHLWDELVNQIAQLDNPSRKLKAGSIGFEMQKQRKAFQLDKSFDTSCDLARCFSFLRQPKKTLDLQFAERAGFKMMPNFFFPAVPKVLEDFWVALELIIVLFDFIFNCVVFSGESLDTLVVSFSVVAVILALLDTLLYFTNESSCKRYSKLFRKRHKHNSPLGTDNEDSKSCSKCPKIPESCTKKMGIWTQIIRTLISELILFPLTLADVVELIELRAYAENDAENRINFGLFIVGILFLVVTVYFMRIFMALSSIANVKRLTKTTTDDPTVLIVKFCVHLIGQIVMHAIVVIMISSKFHQGTCIDDIESGENVSVTISPFLWYEIGSGALIPLVGTILFFLLNYPAIKHLSIVMYIDIMTAVVNESFADLIFQGEGLKTAKKKATKVAEKASIKTTRAHFEEYKKRFSFKNRLQYRLTNPFVIICSLLYGYAFIGFFVSHCFGYRDPCDREGGFQFLLGNDVFVTVTFVVGILVSVIANYQLLVAILSLMLVGILATLLSPVLLISLIFLFLTWFSNRHLNRYRKNTT